LARLQRNVRRELFNFGRHRTQPRLARHVEDASFIMDLIMIRLEQRWRRSRQHPADYAMGKLIGAGLSREAPPWCFRDRNRWSAERRRVTWFREVTRSPWQERRIEQDRRSRKASHDAEPAPVGELDYELLRRIWLEEVDGVVSEAPFTAPEAEVTRYRLCMKLAHLQMQATNMVDPNWLDRVRAEHHWQDE
jgi:hypothetical protein